MKIPLPIEVVRELREELQGIYASRLVGVYLYGSYARGEADTESDLDVLVVLHEFDSYGAEVERCGQAVSSLSLHHGVAVSVVFVRQADWNDGDTAFLLNAHEEALLA